MLLVTAVLLMEGLATTVWGAEAEMALPTRAQTSTEGRRCVIEPAAEELAKRMAELAGVESDPPSENWLAAEGASMTTTGKAAETAARPKRTSVTAEALDASRSATPEQASAPTWPVSEADPLTAIAAETKPKGGEASSEVAT